MKDKKLWKSAGIVIVAFVVIGLLADCQRKKEAAREEMGDAPAIDVAEAVTDSVTLHHTYPGYIIANKKVDVVARVNGTLLSQNYRNGQHVQQGDLLFQIERTTYADEVAKAQASLQTARSQYEYALTHYDAVCKALQSDAVSQMEVEQAESAMKSAKASVNSAQAALQTAQTNLGYCTIKAPATGRITNGFIDVGNYVGGAGSQAVLATIYDDATVLAVIALDEAQHQQMVDADAKSIGNIDYNRVKLVFDENLGHDYNGEISYVAPDVDKSTGTLQLKIKINNPYGELRDGMYCKATLPYGYEPKALLVKAASVGTDQLGSYLYTVNDSNKVVYTPVTLGETVNDSMRIVISGLQPGAKYVTKALLKVRDGMSVKPVTVK